MDEPDAEARDGEDALDDEAAGEDFRAHGTEVGEHGEESIAQSVDDGNSPRGEPFCSCGADVVLVEDFDQVCAREACDEGDRKHGEGERGEDRVGKGSPSCYGKKMKFESDAILQQGGEDKVGDADAECGESHCGVVLPACFLQRRPCAQEDSNRNGEEKRLKSEAG